MWVKMLKNPKNIVMMAMHSSSAREGTWESRLSKLEVNRSYNENVGCCTVKQADISSLTAVSRDIPYFFGGFHRRYHDKRYLHQNWYSSPWALPLNAYRFWCRCIEPKSKYLTFSVNFPSILLIPILKKLGFGEEVVLFYTFFIWKKFSKTKSVFVFWKCENSAF